MSMFRHLRKYLATAILLCPLAAPAQSFLQPAVIPTGNWPDAIYSADINSDGYPDLVYIDHGATPQSSTTHVLLNDGHGNFTPSATLGTAGAILSAADIDQDGHPDITWLQYSGNSSRTLVTTTVARGNGDGTFQTPVPFGTVLLPPGPVGFTSLIAGHIVHSAQILDLAFVNSATPQLIVMSSGYALTTGTGTYTSISGQPGPIALADLNNDGYQDIILQQGTTSATVYLSQPVPTAPRPYATQQALTPFAPPSGIYSLLAQDVNFDGRPDLIVEGANGHIDVFPGNGDGTFQSTSIGGTGPLDGLTGNGGHLIAIADLNHDGLLDAITITPAGVSTLLGQGTAYLGLKGIFNAGPTGQSSHPSFVTADFNNDGNIDLAVDSPEGIAILYGSPDGTFQTSRAFAAGQPALSSATGAFTPSGHTDVVVSTAAYQAQLLLGQGDGTLLYQGAPNAQPTPTTSQTSPPNLYSTVLAGDFNRDGALDIALSADGPPSALLANGTGLVIQYGDGLGDFSQLIAVTAPTLTTCSSYPAPLFGTSLLSDFNADGFPDLASRDFNGFFIYESTPQIPPILFDANIVASPCVTYPHNLMAAADFTGDSLPDLFVEADGHLRLFPNVNGGHFPLPLGDLAVDGSLTTPGQLTAPILLDLYGGYVGTSSGGLGFTAVLGSLTTADLDRDGNQDLIAVYNNFAADPKAPSPANPSYVYIWFGDATGHFPVSAKHPVNPVRFSPSRNFYKAAVADLNRDGIPDLILTDGYLVSVQRGVGDGTFGPETHYLAGQGINSLSIADLRNSGEPDLIIANGGAYLADPAANRDLLATNPDVNTGGVTILLNSAPNAALVNLPGSVVASPEPSTFGTDFYLTALFNPPANSPAPTGTVTFSLDGAVLGTVTIYPPNHPGIDFPAPNTLPVGSHTITAAYSGDNVYAPATYTATHVVTAAAVLGTVSASPEPSAFGSPFTITATGFSAGSYSFTVDGAPAGTVTTTASTASVPGPTTLSAGTHTLGVTWLSSASALARVATGTHVVTAIVRAPTSLSLLLCVDAPGSLFPCATPLSTTPLKSPISMYYGQILDGVVTESSTMLTGTIDFLDGTHAFCTINANLAGGMSTCPPAAGMFHAGSRIVTAAYSGDTLNAPSTSNAIAVNVLPDLTSATLNTSLSPASVGQPVTFTIRVTGNFATPSGTVNFSDGLNPLGSATLDVNGMATLTTSSLTVGTHAISATYLGTSDFSPAPAVVVSQVITSLTTTLSPTTVTLIATGPTTIYFNQPAYSSYSVIVVNPFQHPASGTITVQDNGVNVAICTNIPNGSTCPYAAGGNLTVGIHAITVLYNGDSFNAAATSPAVVFTVLPLGATLNLSSSLNPAPFGTSVTLTATSSFKPSLGVNVSIGFYDGINFLGNQPLTTAGTATFTTSSLAVGTHPITATFPTTPNLTGPVSPALNQVITAATAPTGGFSLTVTPNPVTIAVGRTGALLVTVTAPTGFTSPITLSCSSLPTQAACNFLQAVIPAAGGSTTLQLSTAAPHNCGDPTHPYFISSLFPPSLGRISPRAATLLFPATFLLTLGLARSRRRLRNLALTLVAVALSGLALTSLSGCGACTDLGTRPGRYTLTVTATPQGGSSASQPVNLIVNLP